MDRYEALPIPVKVPMDSDDMMVGKSLQPLVLSLLVASWDFVDSSLEEVAAVDGNIRRVKLPRASDGVQNVMYNDADSVVDPIEDAVHMVDMDDDDDVAHT